MESPQRINFDRMGSIASVLCAVHCALSGFALGLISLVGLEFLASEKTEVFFILLTLGLGLISIYFGYTKHKKAWPSLLFLMGGVLVTAPHFLFGHGHEISIAGRMTSILGAACLVGFHFVNQKLVKAA
jgi:hypothetical protein